MSLKSMLVGLVVAAFAVVSFNAMAEQKAEKADAGAKHSMAAQELTLTGKLILKEDIKGDIKATDKVKKDEEVIKIKGSETIVCKYALVTEDGEVALPEPKAKGGEKAIDMAALVGKTVKVVAKGKVKTDADGKKHVMVKSIESIAEEGAPAAAPAAPAAQ